MGGIVSDAKPFTIQQLDALTPRQRSAIELRHGLIDGVNRTMQDVGKELGISRAAVSELERKAVRTMSRIGTANTISRSSDIAVLRLSIRVENALRRSMIETVGDLVDTPTFYLTEHIPMIGRGAVAELTEVIGTLSDLRAT